MFRKWLRCSAVIPAVSLLVLCAVEGTVTGAVEDAKTFGLYNTGVWNNGSPIVDDHGWFPALYTDPHYSFASMPPGAATTSVYKVLDSAVPAGWVSNTSSGVSRWVGSYWLGEDVGNNTVPYVYRTHFNLAGALPSQVTIHGRYAVDNTLQGLRVNGAPAGVSGGGFGQWTDFTLHNGFQAGVNTLDFEVINLYDPAGNNPTGLRVEFTSIEVQPVATALGIELVQAPRTVNTSVQSFGGYLLRQDAHSNAAGDFGAYSGDETSEAGSYGTYGTGNATQNSTLLGEALTASGTASSSGLGDPGDIFGSGASTSSVTANSTFAPTFLVVNETTYHLFGELTESGTYGGAWVTLVDEASNTLLSITTPGAFSEWITLQPGQYTLTGGASASGIYGDTADSTAASYHLTFTVPEPTSLALLAMGALSLLRRRRRLHHFCR